MKRDPTRLVNVASGGNFWPVGHFADNHNYPLPSFPQAESGSALRGSNFDDFVKVVGEYGGHGFALSGHMWIEETGVIGGGGEKKGGQNWGYGKASRHAAQLREVYRTSLRELKHLKESYGVAAGVYTQTTDVEGEINGLLTYDRKVAKLDPVDLKEWHAGLVEAGFEL